MAMLARGSLLMALCTSARAWETIAGLKTQRMTVTPAPEGSPTIAKGDTITVHATGVVKETDKKFWSTKDPGQQPFTYNAGVGSVITAGTKDYFGRLRGPQARHPRRAGGYGKGGFPAWGFPRMAFFHTRCSIKGKSAEVVRLRRHHAGKKSFSGVSSRRPLLSLPPRHLGQKRPVLPAPQVAMATSPHLLLYIIIELPHQLGRNTNTGQPPLVFPFFYRIVRNRGGKFTSTPSKISDGTSNHMILAFPGAT